MHITNVLFADAMNIRSIIRKVQLKPWRSMNVWVFFNVFFIPMLETSLA